MSLSLTVYDPHDHKLSNILSSGIGCSVTSIEHISSAFSLYFSWQDNSSACVRMSQNASQIFQCQMSRDEEERNFSQLFVSVPLSVLKEQSFFGNLFIRFSIFETCFEFESEIIDAWQDTQFQWFIVPAPTALKTLRSRKSPRASQCHSQETVTWVGEITIEAIVVQSVGLNSLVVSTEINPKSLGHILIQGKSYNARCVRSENCTSYVEVSFDNDLQAGEFFTFYARSRYPSLIERQILPINEVLNLYERTGFFSNFQSVFDEPDKMQKVVDTWEKIKTANHSYTADFCIRKNTELIGASSLGHCFKQGEKNYWVFHQLCSDKERGSYDDTGDLYTWRAEYLWAKKTNLTSVFWFRSKSRWLERIYVKFLMQNPELGELREGNTYSYVHYYQNSEIQDVALESFGDEIRAYIDCPGLIAGAGPDYVHANRNMNIIMSFDGDWKKILKAANSICKSLKREKIYFRLDLPIGALIPENLALERQDSSDRFARIEKGGMLDLIPCIRHSIAITKSKKGVA